MIERALSDIIRTRTAGFPVLVLTGPRQSGKTTLVRHLFADRPYRNLEQPQDRQFALDDPVGFLQQFPDGAVLDEIQRAPELLSWIQTIVDERPAHFVLTGSNNLQLAEQINQSLAGRAAILHLLPFDQEELGDTASPLEQRLFRGSYPPVVAGGRDPQLWYESYIATYVERDVRLIRQIADLDTFQRFVRLAAGRTGQLLNLSSLASDTGITQPTARAWLGILEASFLTFRLQPYYKNYRKRIVKTPKLYFYDTGLACALLGIGSAEELTVHSMRGPLFETWCVSEWIKTARHRGHPPQAYFWRDHTGHEVDLVLDREPPVFVEFKSGQTVPRDAFDNLLYLQQQAHLPEARLVLAYGGNDPQHRTNGDVVPWYDLPRTLLKRISGN